LSEVFVKGEHVEEAFDDIQPRWVTAFSEIMQGLPRDMSLFNREWLDDCACAAEKRIALTSAPPVQSGAQ
jgi:hypothetical protein